MSQNTAPPDASPETSPERQAVARIAAFFENLNPADVNRMAGLYTPQAYFEDPFNEVHGLDGVQRIFSHMFVALDQPHFVVTGQLVDGAQCFLTWDFVFRFKRYSPTVWQTVRGG